MKHGPDPVGKQPKGLRWGPYGMIITDDPEKPDDAQLRVRVDANSIGYGDTPYPYALGATYWDVSRWVTEIWSWGP